MSQLQSDRLSFLEALGQSVANVSPTLTPAIAVAVVVATAGTASWLVYVLATISLVVVGYNIGKLAGKISAAGSFFIYISRGLNPAAGMLAGWAMLAAYGAAAAFFYGLVINFWFWPFGAGTTTRYSFVPGLGVLAFEGSDLELGVLGPVARGSTSSLSITTPQNNMMCIATCYPSSGNNPNINAPFETQIRFVSSGGTTVGQVVATLLKDDAGVVTASYIGATGNINQLVSFKGAIT